MADMGNSGMMSQAELDALIASAGADEETPGASAGDGMDFGSMTNAAANNFPQGAAEAEPPAPASKSGAMSQADLDALMGGASTPSPASTPAPAPKPSAPSSSKLGLVDLPSFAPAATAPRGLDGANGIGRVRDIPLEVTVELGRTRLLIRDIMDLSAGSIIELDKIAGEPVDLFANGMLVARGEVIVIDDNFGVRVTEIITAGDRSAEKDAQARAA